ncbi:TolB family protein [Mariprofundus ferrinatatus]|uniref:TolB family protein n=1 Tax=Mariprofundus ferrinatatus TaxID=1921087 RepID=UPI0018E1E6A5|nr:PD40 domain-containing protein [Mariprofundus ferrinatatus]
MSKLVMMAFAVMAASSTAFGDDLLDWLQEVTENQEQSVASAPSVSVRLETHESGENEMYPKASPDGKYMLVVSGKRNSQMISRRLLENGDPINVVTSDTRAFNSAGWHGPQHVTFLSDRGGDLGVWQVAANGEGPVRRLYRLSGQFVDPIVLEGGGLIAVGLLPAYGRGSVNSGNISRVDFNNWKISGHETRLLHISEEGVVSTLTAGVNPSLSPNGKSIVFSMQAGKSWHLFMVNVDGSNLIQLTNSRSIDVQPTWSPDGKWVAFTSNRSDSDGDMSNKENWDIWMIRRDGRHLTRLTFNPAHDGAPAIGSNGRVYFHSDRKVDKQALVGHGVSGSTSGFHIWSAALPAMVD